MRCTESVSLIAQSYLLCTSLATLLQQRWEKTTVKPIPFLQRPRHQPNFVTSASCPQTLELGSLDTQTTPPLVAEQLRGEFCPPATGQLEAKNRDATSLGRPAQSRSQPIWPAAQRCRCSPRGSHFSSAPPDPSGLQTGVRHVFLKLRFLRTSTTTHDCQRHVSPNPCALRSLPPYDAAGGHDLEECRRIDGTGPNPRHARPRVHHP